MVLVVVVVVAVEATPPRTRLDMAIAGTGQEDLELGSTMGRTVMRREGVCDLGFWSGSCRLKKSNSTQWKPPQ